MNTWPVDDRDHRPAARRRLKGRTYQAHYNYPHLELGSNLVNLFENDGRLEWSSIVKNPAQGQSIVTPTDHYDQKNAGADGANRLRMGYSATIFPPTRPPQDREPRTTILRDAGQGENFLRTYLPDADIPTELIRSELSRDAKTTRKLKQFDPYLSSLLASITVYDTVTTKQSFLAFPMGELNRHLNLSQFHLSGNQMVFKPLSYPAWTFETPIQQISATRAGSSSAQRAYLAIRTFGYTSLLEVKTGAVPKMTPPVGELTRILRSDTANCALVDLSLSPSPFEVLAVNDLGALYKCDVTNGKKYVNLIYSSIDDTAGRTCDSFWRLTRCDDSARCLLASSKTLKEVDLRSNDALDLFSIESKRHVLTSLESQSGDDLIRLCSTRDLFWIDRRFPGKPLLGYAHGREYDRSLEARTVPLPSASTILTSRKNGMITVYDVSLPNGQVCLDSPPYCLFSEKQANGFHLGQTFLSPPMDITSSVSLLRLSDRGSLHQIDLHSSRLNYAPIFETLWSTGVKQLGERTIRASAVSYGSQDFTEVDLSSAYDGIFRTHAMEKLKAVDENLWTVHGLEKISTFWQELDPRIEHMLTTYDAIVRVGDDPDKLGRTEVRAEGIINSTGGYRGTIQARSSAQALAKDAPWHYNLTQTLRCFDSNFTDDIRGGQGELHQFNLAEDPQPFTQSIRQENGAREELALDLSLSTDVFSGRGFSKSSNGGNQLENLTKKLSLAGEPASIDFGYLRPRYPTAGHYSQIEKDTVESVGVRNLLEDWKIGADPEKFTSRYAGDVVIQTPSHNRATGGPDQHFRLNLAQQPPMVQAVISKTHSKPLENGYVHSQRSDPPPPTLGLGRQMTPEYGISTQILPGAYGGRPFSKRKATKKRVGGF